MLSMQAAGAASEFIGASSSKSIMREGRKVEEAGFEANMELAKVQAAQESLTALENLRQTLGSQIAVQTARGTSSGTGSALFIQEESKSQFNRGESARRMNLLAQQAGLRAGDVLSGLELYKSETQLGQQQVGALGKLIDTMQTPSGSQFLKNKGKK